MPASSGDCASKITEGVAWSRALRLPLRLPPRMLPCRLRAGIAVVALHAAILTLALSGPASHTRPVSSTQNIALIMTLPQPRVAEPLAQVEAPSLRWQPSAPPLPPPLAPVTLPPDAGQTSAAPQAAAPRTTDAPVRTFAPAAATGQPQREADVAASYAQRLWVHIRAHRPKGLQLQGTAEIGFRIDRRGSLVWARLARSSGIALLDRLALRAVREASPLPAPPQELPDARLEFTAPINFL